MYENNYILVHHGIKGMQWGIRRYQNPDGTRTAAGKARDQKRLDKEASKDAQKYAMARQASGKGAGIQRREVNAYLKQKMKDPNYKKSFDDAMEMID